MRKWKLVIKHDNIGSSKILSSTLLLVPVKIKDAACLCIMRRENQY